MNIQMLSQEKSYLYWLCQLPGFGAVTIRKLWERYESFAAVYNIEEKELLASGMLSVSQAQSFSSGKQDWQRHQEAYARLQEKHIQFLTPLDSAYSDRLKRLYDYPMGLYVRGNIPDDQKPSIAIVGARSCSLYGRQVAESFARAFAGQDIQIVSGLAEGIDGAVHRGALQAGGLTYGVLGCGVNICYPSQNYHLFEQMLLHGGVLSEYPPGTKPASFHFPMRNRIISGLSDLVLVVEARERSGSLITAELAIEQGRDVFAVPGRLSDPLSSGCNRLISQGAGIAISPDDLAETLGITMQKKLIENKKSGNSLAKKEKMVYSCLDLNPKHLDDIARSCGFPIRECMGILFDLELNGCVIQTANQYYAKSIQK